MNTANSTGPAALVGYTGLHDYYSRKSAAPSCASG
jgi:hypothetical protein